MMRYLLLLAGLASLAACADKRENTGQRLDFVGTTRLTSSNRTGLAPADTLASRVYAEATDPDQLLTRLRITVKYTPKRSPFVYPTPLSALDRTLIDSNPDDDFIYLDTLLSSPNTKAFLFTSVFGVRTTTGTERWQYELYDTNAALKASRAFTLSMRRSDSLLTYQDYTLKLPVPASGSAARRFLQLRDGLALPAYTVLNTQTTFPVQQAALQDSTDLIVLSDGLTLVSPTAPLLRFDAARWPGTNRRDTRIYLAAGQTATTLASQITDATITAVYNAAEINGIAAGVNGQVIGPVAANAVYAFRTDKGTAPGRRFRYGLILVVSVPTSTAVSTTAGLQLQVRMAK